MRRHLSRFLRLFVQFRQCGKRNIIVGEKGLVNLISKACESVNPGRSILLEVVELGVFEPGFGSGDELDYVLKQEIVLFFFLGQFC